MSDEQDRSERGLTFSTRQLIAKTSALVKRGIRLSEVLLGGQPADNRDVEARQKLQQARKHWERAIATLWYNPSSEDARVCLTESSFAYRLGLEAVGAFLDLNSEYLPAELSAKLFREGKLKTDVTFYVPSELSAELDHEDSWVGPGTLEDLLVNLETFLDEVTLIVEGASPEVIGPKHRRLIPPLEDSHANTAMRHTEQARDNQWWYTKHPARDRLDDVVKIVLVVEGHRCMMTHSHRGRDGRITRSFRFDLDSDRAAWVGLRGQTVTLELEAAPVAGWYSAGTEHRGIVPVLGGRQAPSHKVAPAKGGHTSRGLPKRTTPTLFDAFLFCDWSANGKPKTGKDSLWLADAWFDEAGAFSWGSVENHSTRLQAERAMSKRVLQHRHEGRRTLVGLDFPFGYPASSLPRLVGNITAGWRDLWQTLEHLVIDRFDNSNNRFVVASDLNATVGEHWYWSCPAEKATATLRTTKDGRGNVAEFRVVEESLRRAGRRPFSVWQLFGNGSVGSQSLVGLPCCERLRADEALGLRVWPFETGLVAPSRTGSPAPSILAEVWPGAIAIDELLHPTRDAAQVLSLILWAAERDLAGTLAQSFEVPALSGEDRRRAETVEGWILGWMD